MASGLSVELEGLAELVSRLAEFPRKVEKRHMQAAVRAGARVYRDALRAELPGRLGRDVRVKGTRSAPGSYAEKVSFRRWGHIARWREQGTDPHAIPPKRGKALGGPRLAHPVRGPVRHPGQPARPVVMPTFEAKAGAAIAAVRETLRARIEAEGL